MGDGIWNIKSSRFRSWKFFLFWRKCLKGILITPLSKNVSLTEQANFSCTKVKKNKRKWAGGSCKRFLFLNPLIERISDHIDFIFKKKNSKDRLYWKLELFFELCRFIWINGKIMRKRCYVEGIELRIWFLCVFPKVFP